MKWAILYHTEGHFEELVEQLKHHGYTPQVFCDPLCRERYMPGLQRGSIKCPLRFYIAVPREERLTAEKIVKQWINEKDREYTSFKMNTFSNALKALFFTLVLFFAYCLLYPDIFTEKPDHVLILIWLSVLIWTAFFIFLIFRKPASKKDQRDFTKPN